MKLVSIIISKQVAELKLINKFIKFTHCLFRTFLFLTLGTNIFN